MRFVGTIDAKLDVKGRVFLPSDFRKQLAGPDQQLVLKRDAYQPCLVIYPYSVWNAEVDTLRARLNRWDPRQAMVFRQFMANVEVISLDSSGRFILQRQVIEALGITNREVRFIGVDDRIEVWSKSQMEQQFLDADAYGQSLAELMTSTSNPLTP